MRVADPIVGGLYRRAPTTRRAFNGPVLKNVVFACFQEVATGGGLDAAAAAAAGNLNARDLTPRPRHSHRGRPQTCAGRRARRRHMVGSSRQPLSRARGANLSSKCRLAPRRTRTVTGEGGGISRRPVAAAHASRSVRPHRNCIERPRLRASVWPHPPFSRCSISSGSSDLDRFGGTRRRERGTTQRRRQAARRRAQFLLPVVRRRRISLIISVNATCA